MHEIAYSSKMGRNQKCAALEHGDEEKKKTKNNNEYQTGFEMLNN